MVKQIVYISGIPLSEVIDYCQKNQILVEAFSPDAKGKLMDQPEIIVMAEKYHVSVPQ